ncbi:AbrB/MazE/SpoVT family DNA-binding domain-containing protein [Brevundimonas naejangsanensis]|uniref:AbrB/MazE/SpoVT family DNA-binding domain-containing protein n=1 Tax=Brevundimonas naejangsanensis TaxID=588932 RepID=UPI003D163BD8
MVLTITSKIRSRGRITIPREVRDALGLQAVDVVSFSIIRDRAIMRRFSNESDPFAYFQEWGDDLDVKGYRSL